MADVNLRSSSVSGRAIALTDRIFAADGNNADAAAAWKSDTLSEFILTIMKNPSSTLTAQEQTAFRTAIGAGDGSSGGRTKILLVTSGTLETTTSGTSSLDSNWTISTQGGTLGVQIHSSAVNRVYIPHIMPDVYQLVVESEVSGTPYDRVVLTVGPSLEEANDFNQEPSLRFSSTSFRTILYHISNTGTHTSVDDKDSITIRGSRHAQSGTIPANSRVKIYALQD